MSKQKQKMRENDLVMQQMLKEGVLKKDTNGIFNLVSDTEEQQRLQQEYA